MKNIKRIFVTIVMLVLSISCVKMNVDVNFKEFDKGNLAIRVAAAEELVSKDQIETEINKGIEKLKTVYEDADISYEFVGTEEENFSLSEEGKDMAMANIYLVKSSFNSIEELKAQLDIINAAKGFDIERNEEDKTVKISISNNVPTFNLTVNGKILTVDGEESDLKNTITVAPGLNKTVEIVYKESSSQSMFIIISIIALVVIVIVGGVIFTSKNKKDEEEVKEETTENVE